MDSDKSIIGNNEQITGNDSFKKTVPVVEEQLHIGKKIIETGKVQISKTVTEHEYLADMPVFKDEVIVERKTIQQYIDGDAPGIRLDGDTTIIPVIKEVIVKRLILVEEIYITKRRTETTMPIHEVLRKEEVKITRTKIPATGEGQ